jgi:hypothetical protein
VSNETLPEPETPSEPKPLAEPEPLADINGKVPNGCPPHPFAEVAEAAPMTKERLVRGMESKQARIMLDLIIIASILFAVVPQVAYTIWLWRVPDGELSWQTRDQAILFGATSNLTNIVIMLASIYFVRVMAKRLDTYDELLERGMSDFARMKSRLVAWSFDLDSFSDAMDDIIELYHTNKKEFKEGVKLAKILLPALPALMRRYQGRMENFAKLSPKEQDEIIKTILER